MQMLRIVLPVLLLVAAFAFPVEVSAGIFEPIIERACYCDAANNNGVQSAPDFGCVLSTVQNVINLAVSVGVLLATLVIAYAGALWILSPISPKNRELGRTMLLNAVIGLVIVLLGWIFVDFLMKSLYNPDASGAGVSRLGAWNEILSDADTAGAHCIRKTVTATPRPTQPTTGTVTTEPGPTEPEPTEPDPEPTTQPTGNIPARICSAANAYRNHSTTACNCGGNACAWAVNEVLKNANLSPIGSTQVAGVESGLRGGRGQSVSQSSAVCGDIVIVTGARTTSGNNSANHIGICLNSGCTSVISNSSSRREFRWVSPPTFTPSYINASPRFYRVTN